MQLIIEILLSKVKTKRTRFDYKETFLNFDISLIVSKLKLEVQFFY
jgi:hypothetical protein